MKKKIVIAILAIALLTLGAFIGSLTLNKASAQTSTPTTEATNPAATPAPGVTITEDDDDVPFGRGYMFGIAGDDTAVAEKLGKTVEEMTAARIAAFEKAVADAVTAGVITQTQADRITTDGVIGWGQLVNLAGEDYASTLDQEKYFAEALGVTVEALNQARAEVRADRLAAAVEAGTLTQEQADLIAGQQALANSETFQENVKASREEAINQAVTDGIITQSQADALIAQLANQNFGRGMMGSGFGFCEGIFGGRDEFRRGGMMGGYQNNNRSGMLGGLVDGLQNGFNRMFGGNQNGTPAGRMGGNQPGGMMGGRQGGFGSGLGTCDGTCTQTNP